MAGYFEFTTGQVLTAAQVNDFLMEQAVMTFADDAARTTALAAVLREGLLTYNLDTNALERYDGTAWVPASPTSKVKNVYYAQMTVVQSFSSTNAAFVDLTGLSITLTPESEDSKFLVETVVYGSSAITNLRTGMKARILVGSTGLMDVETLYSASDNNEVVVPLIVSVLDAPGVTTSLTYKVAATQAQSGTSQTVFINRRESNTDIRALSFLRITEFE